MTITTRFAPSPTGLLHLGHAYAALFAAERARQGGGRFLVRIEDIDQSRARPVFVEAIFADLDWLGLSWEQPVRRQSDHFDDYRAALAKLDGQGLLYPCFCTRADIAREIKAAGAAPQGPDGPLYPGTCRALPAEVARSRQQAGQAYALRLDTGRAAALAGPLHWHDEAAGEQLARPGLLGDVVLARKDVPASYHLAVTIDDAIQGVTLVTRGIDLFAATHMHRLLQARLGLPVPAYHHHRLVMDEAGRRLAKSEGAPALALLREAGTNPAEVRRRLGFA